MSGCRNLPTDADWGGVRGARTSASSDPFRRACLPAVTFLDTTPIVVVALLVFVLHLWGDPLPWFAVRLAAGAMLATVLWLAFKYSRGPLWGFSPQTGFFLGAGYYFFLEALLLSDGVLAHTTARVMEALLLAGLFLSSIPIGALVRAPTPLVRAFHAMDTIDRGSLFIPILGFFAISVFPLLYYEDFSPVQVVYGLLASRASQAAWTRGNFGDERAIFLAFRHFGTAAMLLAVVCAIDMRWRDPRRWVLVCIGVSQAVLAFLSGSRSSLGMAVMSVVGFIVLTRAVHRRRRYQAAVIITAALLLLVMQLMVQNRSVGFYDAEAGRLRLDSSLVDLHVDGSFSDFLDVLSFFPESQEHTLGRGVVAVLVQPVPRVLWPGKPVSPISDYSAWKTGSSEFGGVSATSVGEFYADFGIVGAVIGGVCYGALLSVSSRLGAAVVAEPRRSLTVAYLFGVFILFQGSRNVPEMMSFAFTFPALAIVVSASRLRLLRRLRFVRTRESGHLP